MYITKICIAKKVGCTCVQEEGGMEKAQRMPSLVETMKYSRCLYKVNEGPVWKK